MAWLARDLDDYPKSYSIPQDEKCGIGNTKVTKKFAEMTTACVQEALYPTGGGGGGAVPRVSTFA